jgi:hypothetical protein
VCRSSPSRDTITVGLPTQAVHAPVVPLQSIFLLSPSGLAKAKTGTQSPRAETSPSAPVKGGRLPRAPLSPKPNQIGKGTPRQN